MFCWLFGDEVIIPASANDAYTACSAANQSTSGEPKGRPRLSQSLYASFAMNSCRFSPRKSVVSSSAGCASGVRDSSGIVVPQTLDLQERSQLRFRRLITRYDPPNATSSQPRRGGF